MANASHISIDGVTYDIEPAAPPSVGNGTLTIQKNGTNVQTFSANQSSNATANITVPTKTSELTNDSGYITNAGVTGVKGDNESNYRTGNVNITKGNIGLGNVPNVTTNNQTPTFSQAGSRANIASGETLSTLFGKIMKWFADLKTVAFSGSYNDLSNKPTIPSVGNGTLTIQRNGSNVATFTANQSGNTTANIIDNNTTYSAGTGIKLSGTTFSFNSDSSNLNYTNNIINTSTSTMTFAKGANFCKFRAVPIRPTANINAGVGTQLCTFQNVPSTLHYEVIPCIILTTADVIKGFGVIIIWNNGALFFYSYVTVSAGEKIFATKTMWYV